MFNILIYGDFAKDRFYAASYRQAFQGLGHNVVTFDTRQQSRFLSPWLLNRGINRLTIANLRIRRSGSRRWNAFFLQTSVDKKVDFVFILNGDFIMPETLSHLKKEKISVFIFHADNPFPPFPNHRPETLPCALECDCYFIWSRLLMKRLQRLGVRTVSYLPFAWDADVYPYSGQDGDGSCLYDVVFIGNWSRRREEWLTPIAQLYDLKIWGTDYWLKRTQPGSPLKRCWQGKTLIGREATQVMQKSRIVLNVLNEHNLPDGLNMRSFEVPGCGAFLLSTRTQGLLEIFPEGQAGVFFDSWNELRAQIDRYRKDDQARRNITQQAHAIVKNGHTFLDRAKQMISVFEDLKTHK